MSSSSGSLRQQVLSLYRQILRMGRQWKSANPEETDAERRYILTEARTLFSRNAQLKSKEEIEERILEAEARLQMALHYKNPYPRASNVPPFTLTKGRGRNESDRRREASIPTHLKSYR